jgi:phage terminase Nu1 subunit (DNA packaging protein)
MKDVTQQAIIGNRVERTLAESEYYIAHPERDHQAGEYRADSDDNKGEKTREEWRLIEMLAKRKELDPDAPDAVVINEGSKLCYRCEGTGKDPDGRGPCLECQP